MDKLRFGLGATNNVCLKHICSYQIGPTKMR